MLETLYPSNPATPEGGGPFDFGARRPMGVARQDSFTREDHRAKELGLLRNSTRMPRRSHTFQDYQIPPTPAGFTLALRQAQAHQQQEQVVILLPTPPSSSASPQLPDTIASTDFANMKAGDGATTRTYAQQPTLERPVALAQRAQRPSLGLPRRSYSVVDYEPLPHHHRPPVRGSGGLSIMDLPPELHYTIFDFLDPIDSTCMGLTNKHFYDIHRRLHGTVPLSARRDGPNELEWAWHLHVGRGEAVDRNPPTPRPDPASMTADEREKEKNALAKLRVKGQAYCRKCGVCRCELHKHIQEWMGEGLEYCSVKQKFGPVAPEGSKSFCYMRTPRDPTRCGRHKARKDTVLLQ